MAPMKAKQVQRIGKVAKAIGSVLKSKGTAMHVKDGGVTKKVLIVKKAAAAVVGKKKSAVKVTKTRQTAEQKAQELEKAAVATRAKEVQSMNVAALKDLVKRLGLEPGLKGDMVEKVLGHEAKGREALRAREAKRRDVVAKSKEELMGKAQDHLKELCVKSGLKVGGSKDERIERILAHAQANGEIEALLVARERDERRSALASMDKLELKTLCEKFGVDPLVKEVMVERILGAEVISK